MAVLVSDNTNASYTGNLSAANGFYISRTYNLGTVASMDSLATAKTIPVTFTGAGAGETCKGVVLGICNPVSGPYITYPKNVTVTLEELVGGTTWTARATSTHTPAEINPGRTDIVLGYWLVPFKFATPYVINTTAGIWRFSVIQAASPAGNNWQLGWTTAGNYTYCAWGDATATASSGNDTLIVVDKVVIDMTFTLKPVLGTGLTTYGNCGWICRNTDVTQAGNALLEWQNPAAASYTLTIDGHLTISDHGGMRVGTATSPITYANQAKIVLKSVPSVGSTAPSSIKGPTMYYHDAYQSLYFYGQVPAKMHETLNGNANTGQKVVTTTNATGWKNGDTVYIGKENVGNYGDTTASVLNGDASGTTINLVSNIAGQNRLSGGHIINTTPYGVSITADGASFCQFNFHMISNMVFSGCTLSKFAIKAGINQAYMRWDTEANIGEWLIQDCALDGVAGQGQAFFADGNYFTNIKGCRFNRCVFFRVVPAYMFLKTNSQFGGGFFPSGPMTLENSVLLKNVSYGAFRGQVSMPAMVAHIDNNFFENGVSGPGFAGVGGTFTNNYLYAPGTAFSGLFLFSGLYPADMSGNTINRALNAIWVPTGTVLIGYKMENLTLGNEYANTVDFANEAETYIDLEISSPTGLSTVSANTSLMMPGSKLRIPDATATNDDRVYTPYGNFQRTGTGLADTTSHTAGGYAIRFAPNNATNLLKWEYIIPTGNIQNKTMNIGAYVNIANAAYYAGSYQLPRITVNYDNGTTTYVEAGLRTGWQSLNVPFTPTTTYGQVTVTVSGMTNATGTNVYFYVDDFSVSYPPNSALDLGGLDLWANGLPVTPPIALPISAGTVANQVWEELEANHTTTGTFGETVGTIKTPYLLAAGKVILSK